MLVSIIGYLMLLFLPFGSFFQTYEEAKYVQPVQSAIEQKDADAFVDLLSESLIEEYPEIEIGIENMMNSIVGEVSEIEYTNPSFTTTDMIGTDCYQRYIYYIKTSTDTYSIYLSYCTMSLFNNNDLGISRVVFKKSTDENHSRIVDPDLYFTTGKDCDWVDTRSLNNVKGNVEAEELFYIDGNDTYNLKCFVKQSDGMGIRGEDCVKVWIVPEGKEITEDMLNNPDFIYGSEESHYQKAKIAPGKYWIYVETNNPETEYDIDIETEL